MCHQDVRSGSREKEPYIQAKEAYIQMFNVYASCQYVFSGPPAPMNHVKIFEGWPLRDAPSELVQLWYKTFPPDHGGQAELKNPTRLSNKTSTA